MRTRVLAISAAMILLLAVAFLAATRYVFDPARHNYHLNLVGFETNNGIAEACFRMETRSLLPLEQLGFTMHREIEVTNKWITDWTWSGPPRVNASTKEVRFYLPAPDHPQRWRLSATVTVKHHFFTANQYELKTSVVEPRPQQF
jgi:hypothetical protein